jgi:PIN like domain
VANKLDRAGIRFKRHREFFSGSTDDTVLLKKVGEKKWILITFDKKQRTRCLEKKLIAHFKIREFAFTSNEIGDVGELLIRASGQMRSLCKRHPGPFVASITKGGNVHVRPDDEPSEEK